MNGPHGLVQPPALRNGAGVEVPKLHLLKWSPAPKVNQSPGPHPQMSGKKKKTTAEINISATCTGGGRHGGRERRKGETCGDASCSWQEVISGHVFFFLCQKTNPYQTCGDLKHCCTGPTSNTDQWWLFRSALFETVVTTQKLKQANASPYLRTA